MSGRWWSRVRDVFGAGASAAVEVDTFAAEMLTRLRAAMPDRTMEVDPHDPLAITIAASGAEDELTVNLHRVHDYCLRASAADAEAAKRDYVESISTAIEPLTAATLRIVVRNADYAASVAQIAQEGPATRLLRTRIGEDLYAFVASDTPTAVALVPVEKLASLGLTPAAAWALAYRQTKAGLPPIPAAADVGERPIAYDGHDNLGGLLAQRAQWRRLADAIGPDLFMTIVTDDVLFVGRLPDGPDLDAFKVAAREDGDAQPRGISPHVYRFRDGRWMIAR